MAGFVMELCRGRRVRTHLDARPLGDRPLLQDWGTKMRRIALAAGLLLVHAAASFGQYQPSWRLRHYDLDYQILPAEHLYRGTATLRLENVSGRPQGTVPLAL